MTSNKPMTSPSRFSSAIMALKNVVLSVMRKPSSPVAHGAAAMSMSWQKIS